MPPCVKWQYNGRLHLAQGGSKLFPGPLHGWCQFLGKAEGAGVLLTQVLVELWPSAPGCVQAGLHVKHWFGLEGCCFACLEFLPGTHYFSAACPAVAAVTSHLGQCGCCLSLPWGGCCYCCCCLCCSFLKGISSDKVPTPGAGIISQLGHGGAATYSESICYGEDTRWGRAAGLYLLFLSSPLVFLGSVPQLMREEKPCRTRTLCKALVWFKAKSGVEISFRGESIVGEVRLGNLADGGYFLKQWSSVCPSHWDLSDRFTINS